MPENIGPVRRLWVMTLLGDAASVTSNGARRGAGRELDGALEVAGVVGRLVLHAKHVVVCHVIRPFQYHLFADRDDDGRDPRVRVGVVVLGHAPVDDVVRRCRRRADEESNNVSTHCG